MSRIQKMRFLLSWFSVGFVTFPRIVREAAALFFKRKLHVWYRPEPLKESLGRHADGIETDLEVVFRKYLRFLVEQSQRPLSVRYVPSGVTDVADEIYTSHSASERPKTSEAVEFRVLTPVFYSRFVHYAHDFEGIFSELTENATIWVDKPHVLPDVFLKKGSSPLHASSFTDFVCFKLIQSLRRRPERIPQVLTSAERQTATASAVDIRDFRISSMDAYVLGQGDRDLLASYRAAVLRLFVANHFFLGSTLLLNIVELVGHVGFAWTLAAMLTLP